jgi:hypothetical protein
VGGSGLRTLVLLRQLETDWSSSLWTHNKKLASFEEKKEHREMCPRINTMYQNELTPMDSLVSSSKGVHIVDDDEPVKVERETPKLSTYFPTKPSPDIQKAIDAAPGAAIANWVDASGSPFSATEQDSFISMILTVRLSRVGPGDRVVNESKIQRKQSPLTNCRTDELNDVESKFHMLMRLSPLG